MNMSYTFRFIKWIIWWTAHFKIEISLEGLYLFEIYKHRKDRSKMLYPMELEKPIFHTKIGKQNNAPQNGKILFIGT